MTERPPFVMPSCKCRRMDLPNAVPHRAVDGSVHDIVACSPPLSPQVVEAGAEALWAAFNPERVLPPELRRDHEKAARAVLAATLPLLGFPEGTVQ